MIPNSIKPNLEKLVVGERVDSVELSIVKTEVAHPWLNSKTGLCSYNYFDHYDTLIVTENCDPISPKSDVVDLSKYRSDYKKFSIRDLFKF
jgi:hypothetical protein